MGFVVLFGTRFIDAQALPVESHADFLQEIIHGGAGLFGSNAVIRLLIGGLEQAIEFGKLIDAAILGKTHIIPRIIFSSINYTS